MTEMDAAEHLQERQRNQFLNGDEKGCRQVLTGNIASVKQSKQFWKAKAAITDSY